MEPGGQPHGQLDQHRLYVAGDHLIAFIPMTDVLRSDRPWCREPTLLARTASAKRLTAPSSAGMFAGAQGTVRRPRPQAANHAVAVRGRLGAGIREEELKAVAGTDRMTESALKRTSAHGRRKAHECRVGGWSAAPAAMHDRVGLETVVRV